MNERLREIRKEKGLLQREVAEAVGISPSTYANYEQGTREPPIQLIIAFCKFFQVTSDYLLGLED